MYKLLPVICFLVYISSYGQKKENTLINFNGIYTNNIECDGDYSHITKVFIRFYPNGEVIHIPMVCSVKVLDTKDWFNLKMSEPDEIGYYKLNQETIKYYMYDQVEFTGKLTENGIEILSNKDLITGEVHQYSEKFSFVRVDDLK